MGEPGESNPLGRHQLLIWLGAAAFIASLLFTPSGAPIFLTGDLSLYILNATRLLQGQVIYRDFFHFLPPGTELVYLTLFKIFGARAWIPNLTLVVLALTLFGLSIKISRRLMGSWAVLLPGLLLLTVALYNGLDPSHHWFSVVAVMAAATCLIEKRTSGRVIAAGVLCGLASFFTPPRGLLAALCFGLFLLWESRRNPALRRGLRANEARLAASFLLTVLSATAYFAWQAGLGRFLRSTLIFPIRYYPADAAWNTPSAYLAAPPGLESWRELPAIAAYMAVHFVVPGIYLLFAVRYRRQSRGQPQYPWESLMLVNLTGLALFLSVANAPAYFRLCVISLPAWILLGWMLTLPGRAEHVVNRLVWAFALLSAVFEVQHVQRHITRTLNMPSGRAAFSLPICYEEYAWLRDHTRTGDFFFEAGWPDIYLALGLRDPAPVPFVRPNGYTRPAQVRSAIDALESRHVRLVLWSFELDLARPGDSDSLGLLRADLREHYQVVKTFSNGDQVWQRRE